MKTYIILIAVFLAFVLASCEKNEITFGNEEIDLVNSAQVRLVYDLPLVASTTHNIKRLKYNDSLVSMVSTPLGSVFPNSAAKYHVVKQGNVRVDTYKWDKKDSLFLYGNEFSVSAGGKYSVYIYDATQPPLVIKDADTFPTSHPWNDTLTNIQFVNLLYKADGVTPFGPLTLKGRRGAGTTASPYVYIDIATCDFKQASVLKPYKLVKSGTVWSGTETGMAFVLFDSSGNLLQHFPSSSGALTNWAATGFSMAKGRNYVFHLNGKLGAKYIDQSIRLSTFGLN